MFAVRVKVVRSGKHSAELMCEKDSYDYVGFQDAGLFVSGKLDLEVECEEDANNRTVEDIESQSLASLEGFQARRGCLWHYEGTGSGFRAAIACVQPAWTWSSSVKRMQVITSWEPGHSRWMTSGHILLKFGRCSKREKSLMAAPWDLHPLNAVNVSQAWTGVQAGRGHTRWFDVWYLIFSPECDRSEIVCFWIWYKTRDFMKTIEILRTYLRIEKSNNILHGYFNQLNWIWRIEYLYGRSSHLK